MFWYLGGREAGDKLSEPVQFLHQSRFCPRGGQLELVTFVREQQRMMGVEALQDVG